MTNTRDILTTRHLSTLTAFAASNVLLAFDYDGTLAPIARVPAAARMRPDTARLLSQVARRYPCVVISGRPLDDLTERLRGIPVWRLLGDHGFEPSGSRRRQAPHVRAWVEELRRRLPAHRGLAIEEKKHSVTVHYRQVKDKRRALDAITEAVSHLDDARAVSGAQAVNLLPHLGPHKGQALQRARRASGCAAAIYVGDDGTDEDAFASAPPDRLLSIRVGSVDESLAGYRIRTQRDIDALLRTLLDLRLARATVRPSIGDLRGA